MTFVDSLNSWIALILGIFAIISGLAGFVYWLHNRFTKFIKFEIQEVAKEFKSNGGSSLKDQVNRLEKQHSSLANKVDEIYDLLTTPTKPTKLPKSKN
jgi:uncharacterized iron-regulated membrane protein